MKSFIIICFVLCAVAANPVPEKDIDMLRIPLEGDKELDVLTLADEDGRINARNKRTLSLLRELFPSLTQLIDQKSQMFSTQFFRIIGPILLRGGPIGTPVGRADFDDDFSTEDDDDTDKKDNNSGGRKVSISLPTYAPEEDDDDDTVAVEKPIDKNTADGEFVNDNSTDKIDSKESSSSESNDKEKTTTTKNEENLI